MLSELTQALLDGIRSHGILAVILGVAIETIIVPLPSPIILMAAGVVLIGEVSLSVAVFNAAWIAAVAGLAQTIGSFLVYGIAYLGGKPLIVKFEKLHGVSWEELIEFQKKFSKGKKEDFTLFLLRALPIMPLSVVSGVAGIIKMDWKRFAISTFLGTIPRNMFLALMGWQMQEIYVSMAGKIDHLESIITICLVALILLYVVLQKTGVIWKVRQYILK